MNLIDESYNKKSDSKKILLGLAIGIIVLIFIIIALLAYVTTMKSNKIKLIADSKEYNYSDYLLNKDNVYYIWIEGLTKIIPSSGYSYKSGDIDVEDENKCYITNSYESTFFNVESNEIYKVMEETEEIAFYTLDNPIIKDQGKIYMPVSALNVAANSTLNMDNNIFKISSIGYLEGYYNQPQSATFNPDTSIVWETSYSNKKLLKNGLVIIKDASEKLGLATISSSTETKNKSKVTTVSASPIIAPKYNSIEYVEKYNQLIVESESNTKGIIQLSADNGKETIVTPQYDDIEPINEKLFLVSKSTKNSENSTKDDTKKYGIVGLNEEEILPIEYNEIGIDLTKFTNNDLNNRYIIYDSLIPVKKDKLWGFVDLNGKVVIKLEYDDLGCSSSNSSNNVLIVPELNAIVVKKDNKYGLITKKNLVLAKNIFSRVFKEEVDGKEEYSVIKDNKKQNLIDYINSLEQDQNKNQNKTQNQNKDTGKNSTNTANDQKNSNTNKNNTTTSN